MPDPQNWKKKYHYRLPLVMPKHHCGSCAAFKDNHCAMFDDKVNRDATCDEWTDDFPDKGKADSGKVSSVLPEYDDTQDSMLQRAEMVPLSTLQKMRDYEHDDRLLSPERFEHLKSHIAQHGVTSPVWIDYHPEKGIGHLSEGNHRLAAAEELGLTHLPAVVYNSRRTPRGSSIPLTYNGETHWDGYPPQYMKPSDFPELNAVPGNIKQSAYMDFTPNQGQQDWGPEPEWDADREMNWPQEGGGLGSPPMHPFPGHSQNDYNWQNTGPDVWGNQYVDPDHEDETLLPEHWKDNFVGPDPRPDWRNPMDALRAHAQHLANQHGISWDIHPKWNDDAITNERGSNPSDYALPSDNVIHTRPVTNRMRYLVALHEIAHCAGGTEEDHAAGISKYGPHVDKDMNPLPGRIPLDYDRQYKPKGYNYDPAIGGYPPTDVQEPGFKNPSEWEVARPEFSYGEEYPTSPYNPRENKLETEARAWDWAMQHSAIKVTPDLLRQTYRFMTSYANPGQHRDDPRDAATYRIRHYSPTFKRLWNEGEHPEGEGWSDPTIGEDTRRKRIDYYGYDRPRGTEEEAQAAADRFDKWYTGNEAEGFIHPDYWENAYHMKHPETGEERWFEHHHPLYPFENKPPHMAYVPPTAPVSPSKTIAALIRVIPLPRPPRGLESHTERPEVLSVQRALEQMPELRDKRYEVQGGHPLHGHCYVGSESLYHLMGGKQAGLKPMQQNVDGVSHWWLQGPQGEVLDPTAAQFDHPVDYTQGVGRGFLTSQPSQRAQQVLDSIQQHTAGLDFTAPPPRPGEELPSEHKWIYNPDTQEFHTWGGAMDQSPSGNRWNEDFRSLHHHDEAIKLGWVPERAKMSGRPYLDGMYYTDPTPGQTYWSAFRTDANNPMKPIFDQHASTIHDAIQQAAGQPIPYIKDRLNPIEGLVGRDIADGARGIPADQLEWFQKPGPAYYQDPKTLEWIEDPQWREQDRTASSNWQASILQMNDQARYRLQQNLEGWMLNGWIDQEPLSAEELIETISMALEQHELDDVDGERGPIEVARLMQAIQGRSAGADHDGAMVALMLKPEQSKKLHVDGGEPTEDMHITIVYFQDKAADRDDWERLHEILKNVAHEHPKLTGTVGGTGTFAAPDKDVEPYIGTIDLPELAELHLAIKDACEQAGFPVSEDHGFNPHVTLKYVEKGDDFPEVDVPVDIDFDGFTLMIKDEPTDFKLEGEIVKTSDWKEQEHPRKPSGKFTVRNDQHEVKVTDEKGKHKYTVKRCRHCGVTYGKKPTEKNVVCPTCGQNPERKLRLVTHIGADPDAVADSLGWRFWQTNHNGHRMYQWEGPNRDGEQVAHIVTGYGNHAGDNQGANLSKMMKSCMNGTCSHVALPGSQTYAEPETPVLRAGQEVMYGNGKWWIIDQHGDLSHIADSEGHEDIVRTNELRAASWEESNED